MKGEAAEASRRVLRPSIPPGPSGQNCAVKFRLGACNETDPEALSKSWATAAVTRFPSFPLGKNSEERS